MQGRISRQRRSAPSKWKWVKTMMEPHIRDYQGKHIHMIGIGGSSMSGLAQLLLEKGYLLTGSDNL